MATFSSSGDDTPLEVAAKLTEFARVTLTTRDDAIRAAHAAGETIRAVAAATGLSSARVHQILHGR